MFTKTKKWLIAALAAIAIIALSVCGALNFTSASAEDINWDEVKATEVNTASELSSLESGKKYKLTADVSLESSLTIAADTSVYLDLNGYTLSLAEGYATTSVITVNGSLTLADSSTEGTGKITNGFGDYATTYSSSSSYLGGGVLIGATGSFTMLGGTITGNQAYYGGGVYITGGGIFTMEGGTISYNEAVSGAGVYLKFNTLFTMEDGCTITYNIATNQGGAICNDGTFIMNGGEISYNEAAQGAGIKCSYVVVINDGKITNNTATTTDEDIVESGYYGGGIYMTGAESGLYLYGGEISGNSVESNENGAYGGGVYSTYTNINLKGSIVVKDNVVDKTTQNIYLNVIGLHAILDGELNADAYIGFTSRGAGMVLATNGYTVSGTISSDDASVAISSNTRGYYYGSAYGDTTKQDSSVASVMVDGSTYYYDTLSEAIASNLADEYTVTVLTDVTLTDIAAFPKYGSVTLTADSNVEDGITIKVSEEFADAYWFFVPRSDDKAGSCEEKVNTTVTVTGNLIFDGGQEALSSASSVTAFYCPGNLVIGTDDDTDNDPTFENFYISANGILFIAYTRPYGSNYRVLRENNASVYNSATLTVNGGLFTNNKSASSASVIYGNNASIITINGGTFDSNEAVKNGAAIYAYTSATVTINYGTFTNNKAENGAIYVYTSATVNIYDGLFEGNVATSTSNGGGVIYAHTSAAVTIYGGTFIKNKAESANGGVVYMLGDTGATLRIEDGYFGTNENGDVDDGADTPVSLGNTAKNHGSVVYAYNGTAVKINGGTFNNNQSTSYGGVIYSNRNTTLTINGGTFDSNKATNYGGVIYTAANVTATISNAEFTNNYSKNGGAIYFVGTAEYKLTLENCKFENNRVSGYGGALNATESSVISISGCEIIENGDDGTDATLGGAIFVSQNSKVTISDSSITGNESQTGNIYVDSSSSKTSTLSITDSSITGNTATTYAAGIYVKQYTTLTVSGDTVISNNKISENESNVYLNRYATITFGEGGLGDNAHIGVTVSSASNGTQVTTAEITTTYYEAFDASTSAINLDSAALYSDNTTYYIVADTTENYLKLVTVSSISTIVYNANDGSENPTTHTYYTSASSYDIDFTLFSKSEYVLSYNTDSAGSGTAYAIGGTTAISSLATGTTTLYAVWTSTTNTLSVTAGTNAKYDTTLDFTVTYYAIDANATAQIKSGDTALTLSSYKVSESGVVTVTIDTETSKTATIAAVYTLAASETAYSTVVTIIASDGSSFDITVNVTVANAALTDETESKIAYTYDENSHTGSVSAKTVDDSEISVLYSDDGGETYTLETIPAYTDAGNHVIYYQITAANHSAVTGTITVTINALDIKDAEIEITSGELVYNGSEKTVTYTVTLDGIAGEITCTPSGNTATNAGVYTLTLTGSGNFSGTATATWTISKATYDLSGLTMSSDSVVYDGASHTIEISGTLPAGVTVSYSGSYTNVGTYTITATISGDSNYEDATMTATLTIGNASLTVTTSGYTGAYDGTAHTGSVAATTVDGTTATIAYGTTKGTYDLTSIPSYTDAGTYKIYYKVTAANHTTKTGYITVEITSVVTADSGNTVDGEVTSDTFALNTISYVMNEVSADDYADEVERAIVNVVAHIDGVDNAEVVAIYDITLTSNGETITVSEATNGGTITIKVALPSGLSESDEFYIVHIHDGSFKTIISSNSYTVEDGYVTFSTNTLSQFVFVVPTEATADSGSTDSGSTSGGSSSGGSSSGSTDSGSSSVDTGTTDIGTDDGNGTLLTVVLVTGGVVIVLAAVIIVAVVLKKRKS